MMSAIPYLRVLHIRNRRVDCRRDAENATPASCSQICSVCGQQSMSRIPFLGILNVRTYT